MSSSIMTAMLRTLWNQLRGRESPRPVDQSNGSESNTDSEFNPNPDPVCTLLEQPVDIIELILQALTMPERLVLAQTCRALCRIVLDHQACPYELGQPLRNLMTTDEQLHYLYLMTRERLDSWVCSRCTGVHRVALDSADHDRDILVRWFTACPDAWSEVRDATSKRREQAEEGLSNFSTWTVRHDLVQTALKFIRRWDGIGAPRQEFVMAVLRGAHSMSPGLYRSRPSHIKTFINSGWHPKVIRDPAFPATAGDRDGRFKFVTKTIRSYEDLDSRLDMTPSNMPYIRACVHCLYEPEACSRDLDNSGAMPDYQPLCEMVRIAWSMSDGTPVFGACSMCGTDFSVHFTTSWPRKAVLRIWHDLGGEGSTMDPIWRANREIPFRIRGERQHHSKDPPYVTHHHEPGSVMKMYEEGEAVVYTEACWEKPEDVAAPVNHPLYFHVTDPLDEELLSQEHRMFSMRMGCEHGWSIHDL